MRKKWFLVILVFVLGWNISYGEQPVDEAYINDFLNKILDRILQGVPERETKYCNFKIRLTFDDSRADWVRIYSLDKGGDIFVHGRFLLLAENEAEIAFIIAHDVGHDVVHDLLPDSSWMWIGDNFIFKHQQVDHAGIILATRAGYDSFCAAPVLQRLAEEIEKNGISARTRSQVREIKDRALVISGKAKEYFQKDQKKWILLKPEKLEKIKDYCRKFKKRNGE